VEPARGAVPCEQVFLALRLEELRRRCAAADRIVDQQAAVLAHATKRRLAEPENPEAIFQHEDAEQLDYLAHHNQRRAHRTLQRVELVHYVLSGRILVRGMRRSTK
jgi:hypothetical protein